MIERLATQREWTNAGQGWQAKESLLRLDGWSRQRRVIILRRRNFFSFTGFVLKILKSVSSSPNRAIEHFQDDTNRAIRLFAGFH